MNYTWNQPKADHSCHSAFGFSYCNMKFHLPGEHAHTHIILSGKNRACHTSRFNKGLNWSPSMKTEKSLLYVAVATGCELSCSILIKEWREHICLCILHKILTACSPLCATNTVPKVVITLRIGNLYKILIRYTRRKYRNSRKHRIKWVSV